MMEMETDISTSLLDRHLKSCFEYAHTGATFWVEGAPEWLERLTYLHIESYQSQILVLH